MAKTAKTYQEIQAEIEQLSKVAKEIWDQERQEVLGRVREAVRVYRFTASELGVVKPAIFKKAKPLATEPSALYGDGEGNTWGGRGKRPDWLREALKSGKTLESFRL